MLLKESKIPYNFVLCDALKGENRKPDFLKVNAAGLVPAITDGDFQLGESAAILQYLSEKHKLQVYPSDLRLRAKTVFWMHWHHTNSRIGTKSILISRTFPRAISSEKLTSDKKIFTRSLTFMEKHLKESGTQFLVHNELTIADLLIVTEFDQLEKAAFDLFDFSPFPHIQQWMQAIRNKVTSYKEVFDPVVEIAKKFPPAPAASK
jgi:glutathione S-transferase